MFARTRAAVFSLFGACYFCASSWAYCAAPPPQPQGAEYKSSLTGFAVAERERGIAESTLGKCVDYARILLIYAEGKGLTGISALDAPLLLEFMSHMRGVRPGTDPKSTDAYMERNGAPMRACVLPLPGGGAYVGFSEPGEGCG